MSTGYALTPDNLTAYLGSGSTRGKERQLKFNKGLVSNSQLVGEREPQRDPGLPSGWSRDLMSKGPPAISELSGYGHAVLWTHRLAEKDREVWLVLVHFRVKGKFSIGF